MPIEIMKLFLRNSKKINVGFKSNLAVKIQAYQKRYYLMYGLSFNRHLVINDTF